MSSFIDILKIKKKYGIGEQLNEISLSRLFRHVKNNTWGILTSWRAGYPTSKNIEDFKKLKQKIRAAGLGFFKLEGHWLECQNPNIKYTDCPKSELEDVREPSIFVPNINKKFITKLGREFGQDAVIFGEQNSVELIFKNGNEINIGKFKPNKISQAYSKLKGRPFVFEYVAQNYTEALIMELWNRNG